MKCKYWVLENEIDGEKVYLYHSFGGSDFIWTNELSGARFEQTKEDAEWYIHLIAEKQNIDKIVVKEVEITIL